MILGCFARKEIVNYNKEHEIFIYNIHFFDTNIIM